MMANRSTGVVRTCLPYRPIRGRKSKEEKARGFHQGQGQIDPPFKRPDICEQPDSPTLDRQPCAEAGSIYMATGGVREAGSFSPALDHIKHVTAYHCIVGQLVASFKGPE